jgi:hypothetical protein
MGLGLTAGFEGGLVGGSLTVFKGDCRGRLPEVGWGSVESRCLSFGALGVEDGLSFTGDLLRSWASPEWAREIPPIESEYFCSDILGRTDANAASLLALSG